MTAPFHHRPRFSTPPYDPALSTIQFTGNDHVIEFNEVHDVCLPPVYDIGAFYMGRDPGELGNIIRQK